MSLPSEIHIYIHILICKPSQETVRLRNLVHFKNTRVVYDVITRDKTEYYSHALAEVVNGIHENYWILVMISRIAKL